jgi:transcriptional regulator with XRE-family HTH domain
MLDKVGASGREGWLMPRRGWSFAKRLRELREAATLSQYALAQRSGLTKQALSRLELGEREPTWETVQRLALALGVDCGQFRDPGLVLPEPKPQGKPGRPKRQTKLNRAPKDEPEVKEPKSDRPTKKAP